MVRDRVARGPTLEFLIGGFVAWLSMSLTALHDIRYDMPLMPYLAVIATGWIIYLPRVARLAATGVLALAVAANTLGTTFGVGGQLETKLVRSPPVTEALADRIVFYSNRGFLVAGPKRDGDVPGLLQALVRNGVRAVGWIPSQTEGPDFSFEGLVPLVLLAGANWSKRTGCREGLPGLRSGADSPADLPRCAADMHQTERWHRRMGAQDQPGVPQGGTLLPVSRSAVLLPRPGSWKKPAPPP